MPVSEQEFRQMNPEQRKRVLGQLRLENEFKALPKDDRAKINQLLKTEKEKPVTKTDAAIRGAAQGLTFGFADEIAAGLSAAGQSFLGKEEFKPALEKALKEQRERDSLAAQKYPNIFAGAEVTGAIGSALIPFGGQLRLGLAAGKTAKTAKAVGTAAKLQKPSVITKVAGITPEQIGKGTVRGVTGAGKAAAGGALTELGKAEDKSKADIKRGALIGGSVGAAASIAGPVVRTLGKAAVKSPRLASAALSGGKSEAIRSTVNSLITKIPKEEVAAQRLDALARVFEAPRSKLSKSLIATIDGLGEVFEKQGAAGLVTTHVSLLENPEYREFLDKIEKQKGLTAPKGSK